MLIIPDVLSGEGDLPLDLPLELPVKFPQVNPLLLVLIVIPDPHVLLGLRLTVSKPNYLLALWRPGQRSCSYFCSYSCDSPCGRQEKNVTQIKTQNIKREENKG